MKFKHIEVGVEVIVLAGVFKGLICPVAKVDREAKRLYFDTIFGRKYVNKKERGLYWDIYQEPKEATRLKKNDYDFLIDMALAMHDEAWFHDIHSKMKKLGVKHT